MISEKRVLGIITARGGSKGLPGKNVKPLCGKPLIGWTIEAAKQSHLIDDIVVSTDCEQIASISREFGAEIPFLRPANLATDEATSFDVIKHAIEQLQEDGREYEYVISLEPTSPLRESHDIDNAVYQMIEKGAGAIVGVCRAESTNPCFMYRKNTDGFLKSFIAEKIDSSLAIRRQDIEPVYYLEGSVYVSRIDVFLERQGFYHEGTMGYEVPKWKSPEIDDEIDFLLVEAIMKHRRIYNGC